MRWRAFGRSRCAPRGVRSPMGGTTSEDAGGEHECPHRSRYELRASVKPHLTSSPRATSLDDAASVRSGRRPAGHAGGIALTPRVALNTRPQLRFAHARRAAHRAPSNFAPSTRCAPPKMQEAAATPAEPAGDARSAKLLPLGAMFFFILFNYTILRDTKDVLVSTGLGRASSRRSSSASARSRWRRRARRHPRRHRRRLDPRRAQAQRAVHRRDGEGGRGGLSGMVVPGRGIGRAAQPRGGGLRVGVPS